VDLQMGIAFAIHAVARNAIDLNLGQEISERLIGTSSNRLLQKTCERRLDTVKCPQVWAI